MSRYNGLNGSLKNAYRWDVYKSFIAEGSKSSLQRMKQEGVKYIIAIPDDVARLEQIEKSNPTLLKRVDKWVYQII